MRHALLLAALALAACDGSVLVPLRPDAGDAIDATFAAEQCMEEGVLRARVLVPRCGGSDCHGGARPKAGLDLEAPGLAARLVGAPSIHEGCGDRTLVVPGVARASFLVDKVLGLEGTCGDPMPLEGELTLEERRCLVAWIDGLPSGS
ncbi:MAG: hypothetical protein KC619_28295 [Myxococcales bacterium]|nr:hypothetical protein [Myxococcales bacterium]